MGDELVETLRRAASAGRSGSQSSRRSRRLARATSSTATRAARPPSRRLNSVLDVLRVAGIPAHGGVFDDEPLAAVKDVLASEDDRRDHRLHPSGDEVRLAAQEPRRRDREGRRRPPGRARRVGRERPDRRQRPRHRQRDGARRAAPRPHPGARPRGPRELPHRVPAERPVRAASIRRPSDGSAPRSRSCARRVSTSTARSPSPTRSWPRWRRSRTSAPTRSSSPPSPASARAGCGGTSSAGCAPDRAPDPARRRRASSWEAVA